MKAFIVLALVASVAAQMDLTNFRLTRPVHHNRNIEDLLLKEKLGGMDSYKYNTGLDLNTIFGGRNVDLYSFDELVTLPIFREYLTIPLFRNFLEEHPIVFKKYLESALFQQFFTEPAFKTYFRNPIFFYKYIVPQVIAEVYTTEGTYDFDTTTTYPTKYMPYGYRYNKWSIPMTMNNMFNRKYNSFPYTHSTIGTNYLLEKMMSQMNFNKGQDLTETLTDVKMLPNGKVYEHTVGKIVDPITGAQKLTVGDYKTVDEKIVPVVDTMDFPLNTYSMNKIFSTRTVKDAILKHIILEKVLGHKTMTPSVYQTLFPEVDSMLYKHKMNVMIPEMLETLVGNKNVYETIFRNKHIYTPEVFHSVFGQDKEVITPEIYEILFGNKMTTPRHLETIFGKKIYTPEVFGTLFDETMTTPEYYPEVSTYEPYMLKEKMMSPFVTRMLKNNKISQFHKYQTEKMIIDEIKKEKMIDEIRKEKMMEELIKEYPMYKNTLEFPKVFNTEKYIKHIPLTYDSKIHSGSVLSGFENEEIKY